MSAFDEVFHATVAVEVVSQREASVEVTDGALTCLIPHSQIEDSQSDITSTSSPGDEGDLVIPQWLAEDRELV